MLFGSVPSPPRKPRSWTSTQSARQNTMPNHTAYRTSRGRPVRKIAPIAGEHDHHHQVHREAVARRERPEVGQQGGQDVRLRGRGHLLDHAGQGARLAADGALPEAAARPGLQHRHADEEQPDPAQQQPPEPRAPPGVLRQRDQRSGHHVDQHGPGRPGQPAQPGREDPAERLPEHPHHQAPGHAGQPGQPGPRPVHRDQQPGAEPDLDPHRGRAGLDRVEGPDRSRPS